MAPSPPSPGRRLAALCAVVVALAAGGVPVAACVFATTGNVLPQGHPTLPQRRLLQAEAAVPQRKWDTTNSAMDRPTGLTAANDTKWDALVAYTKRTKTDQCYWSMQELPAPYFNASAVSSADLLAILGMGISATERWNAQVKPGGPAVWGGVTIGTELTKRLCTLKLLTSAACKPAVLREPTPWSVASVILRIKGDGSNAAQVQQLIKTWRSSPQKHEPQMASPQVAKGFGYSSRFLAKVVPCSQIPARYQYPKPCSPLSCAAASTNKTYFQEALEAWAPLCNGFYHPYFSPSGGACLKKGTTPKAPNTILGLVKTNPDLSILTSLIEKSSLKTPASSADTAVTLFAPSNTAIVEYLKVFGLTPEALAGLPRLADAILSAHVALKVLAPTDFKNGTVVPTLLGKDGPLTLGSDLYGTLTATDAVKNTVKVAAPNVRAGKSTVYGTDGLLLVTEAVSQAALG